MVAVDCRASDGLSTSDCFAAFACDAAGQVDMDALSERARTNDLYARAAIGREFAFPAVVTGLSH